MSKLDPKKHGIITSDLTDFEYPAKIDLWSHMRPFLEKYKKLTALVNSATDKVYTYEDVLNASLRWAKEVEKHFREGGEPPVVVCMFRNIPEYILVFLGCAAVGAPLVPIRHDYDPGLVKFIISESNASLLTIEETELETFKEVVKCFGDSKKLFVKGLKGGKPSQGQDIMNILLHSDLSAWNLTKKVDPDATLMISFSSGTTGKPKGILKSHKDMIDTACLCLHPSLNHLHKAEEHGQDTIIMPLPFAHSYGVYYVGIYAFQSGPKVITFDILEQHHLIDTMVKYKATVLKVYPYILEELNSMPEEKIKNAFTNVRCIVTLGAPSNYDTFTEVKRKAGVDIFMQDAYGSTEMGALICKPINDNHRATGKLFPTIKARVIDILTGEPILEPRKAGELRFESPTHFEYLNNPEATNAAYDEYGWLLSGDIGYYDEDGYFYVIDRMKDLIMVDGKKVSPTSIENILKKHESVLDVGVVEYVDTKTGQERPMAFVVPKGKVDKKELIDFVKEKAPREMWLEGGVVFVDTLPRNHMGKLERKYLRTMSWKVSDSL